MATILEKLSATQAEAEGDYRRIIARLADGEDVPVAEVHAARIAARRTNLDIAEDMDRLRARREAAKKLARAEKLMGQVAELSARPHTGPLLTGTSEEHELRREAIRLRKESHTVLRETHDPSIDVEQDALRAERKRLEGDLAYCLRETPEEVGRQIEAVQQRQQQADRENRPEEVRHHAEQLAFLNRKLATAKQSAAKVEPLREQIREIDARLGALEDQVVNPERQLWSRPYDA